MSRSWLGILFMGTSIGLGMGVSCTPWPDCYGHEYCIVGDDIDESTCKSAGAKWSVGFCISGSYYRHGSDNCGGDQIFDGPYCLVHGKPDLRIANESACNNAFGKWILGQCTARGEETCLRVQGQWIDFRVFDLGNGRYQWEEKGAYFCGTYNDLIKLTHFAEPCEPVNYFTCYDGKGVCVDVPFYPETSGGTNPYAVMCSQCKEGLVQCGSDCVNLGSDQANCGFCGNACGKDEHGVDTLCHQGQCKSVIDL